MPKGKKGASKTTAAKKPKTKLTGTATIGIAIKPIGGRYYNIVESLDGLVCPLMPQCQFIEPSRAPPRQPPCCPPSACCYPPPCCFRQPGRRCC